MRYSTLFGKTSKTTPHDADSINARLLVQGGFVERVMAGAYAWLPLGLRALRKVEDIIREEMDAIGGQELHLTGLQPKENWVTTGRWDTVDVLFKIPSQTGKEYGLGPTAEEIVTPIAKSFARSYKDFPFAVYQIQTKFRDELRAKSGVLRGREFLMKDLYSFHVSREDFERFYEVAKQAYVRIFERCGMRVFVTEASGGSFSQKVSHEFQIETPAGEDKLLVCRSCSFAANEEVASVKAGDTCPSCAAGTVEATKGIEVGNIFDLGDRFTAPFDLTATGPDGAKMDVIMGCYGIGISRLVGAIVEASNDERGIIWPREVAPYQVHLVAIIGRDAEAAARVAATAEQLVRDMESVGIEVLYDDRPDTRAGEKFADADLIGLPVRLVVSEKTLAEDAAEWKLRTEAEAKLVPMKDLIEALQEELRHEKK